MFHCQHMGVPLISVFSDFISNSSNWSATPNHPIWPLKSDTRTQAMFHSQAMGVPLINVCNDSFYLQ